MLGPGLGSPSASKRVPSEQRAAAAGVGRSEVCSGGAFGNGFLCAELVALFCCLFPLAKVRILWKCGGVIRSQKLAFQSKGLKLSFIRNRKIFLSARAVLE